MTNTRLFQLLAALALAAAPACATDSDATSEQSDELLGAPLDATHTFAVGICAGGLVPAGQPGAGTCARLKCSGTLIAPNLVLTARHCVRDIAYANDWCASTFTNTRPFPTAVPLVTTAPSVMLGTPSWYSVKTELFPAGNGLCTDDVALLILQRSVPAHDATPARVNLARNFATHPLQSVAVVGRGVISDVMNLTDFSHTIVTGDLQRRVLQNIPFECATNNPAQPCNLVDYSSPPTNTFASPPGYLVIGKSTTSGDSGSGVIDQSTFATTPTVIGVTSAGTWGADGLPNHSLIERLDTHSLFIRDGFRKAEVASHGDPHTYE